MYSEKRSKQKTTSPKYTTRAYVQKNEPGEGIHRHTLYKYKLRTDRNGGQHLNAYAHITEHAREKPRAQLIWTIAQGVRVSREHTTKRITITRQAQREHRTTTTMTVAMATVP